MSSPGQDADDRSDFASLTREQVAAFLMSRSEEIRRIAREKFTSRSKPHFDSEDIFSSVLRRMDAMAAEGRVRPRSESELMALARTIAHNEAVSKVRLVARLSDLEREDGEYAAKMLGLIRACAGDEQADALVLRLALGLPDSASRQMFFLRLRGASHRAIAGVLGLTEETVRKKWGEVKKFLAEILAKE